MMHLPLPTHVRLLRLRPAFGVLRPVAAVALAVVALLASSSVSTAATASFGVPQSGRPVLQVLPEEFATNHSYTQAQAVAAAQRYDVIIAYSQAFQPYVAAMRAANPNLVLLVYLNGMFVSPTQGSAFPAADYSYDANGVQVQNAKNHNYLMNPSSSDWVQSRATTCQTLLAQSGYDGCMLDTLGIAPLTAGYCTAPPINPATNAVWTHAAWISATTTLANSVRSVVSPALVTGNGLKDGPTLSESGQLLNGLDGAIAEGFLRGSNAAVGAYPTVSTWQTNVNMLVTASKPVMALTKLWTSATAAQVDQWHRYSLASFLLGTDGRSYFYFTSSSTDPPIGTVPWTVDIGDPSGGYAAKDGVYQRSFSNGLVLVNPSTSPVTVPISGNYVDDFDGTSVNGSLTMPADTGSVLKSVPTTAPGAPSGVSAVGGDASAVVSFSPPADDGGSPISSYTVTAVDSTSPGNGGQTASDTGSPITVSGLTNGDSYTFTVTATNGVGTGPSSSPSNSVTPVAAATKPGAPTGVSATAGDASARVSFSPPSSDGGSAISSYTVTAVDSTTPANGGQTASDTGSPITVSGLTNGDSYTFTVTATNGVGTGPSSSPSNSVVPAPLSTLTITTTAIPFGVAAAPYSTQLTAAGGTGPYTWSVASGTLPSGLSLSGAGVLSGTPKGTGSFSFTISVRDSSAQQQTASHAFTMTIYTKAKNGSGTETITPTTAVHGSSGNTFTLVYTAPANGALYKGKLRIVVPTGWTAPSKSSTSAGFVQSTMGSVATSSQTITITALSVAPGATVTITYGNVANGAAGVKVGKSTGTFKFTTSEGSTSGAAFVALAVSPTVKLT